jgi:hypothetical protein
MSPASLANSREPAGSQAALEWSEIEALAPRLAATVRRYSCPVLAASSLKPA